MEQLCSKYGLIFLQFCYLQSLWRFPECFMIEWGHKIVWEAGMEENRFNHQNADAGKRRVSGKKEVVYGTILDEINARLEHNANNTQNSKGEIQHVKCAVTKDEIITINIMIMVLTWTQCGKRSIEDMANYVGITSKRTLMDLSSGTLNNETRSHINNKIAEKMGKRLGIPAEVFRGEKGVLFESRQIKEKETVLVLYRRLKYLIKHTGVTRKAQAQMKNEDINIEKKDTLRIKLLDKGLLDGLDSGWYSEWGSLEEIKAELKEKYLERNEKNLPKSVTALRLMEKMILGEIEREFNVSPSDEPVKGPYRKMIKDFRYGSPEIASAKKIEIVTSAMNHWTFDALRELGDEELLKKYQLALQEQLAYVGVVLRILKKEH